ncbi:MAG: exodeoxyribonuclease VII large subunit [Acetobacteraceae bacterium]|nr:exodeoxyribonuclease VII large subunit [Acetobacteraceae bacterium]
MSEVAIPPPAGSTGGNVPEYTVSEISGAVKRTLEGAFGRVRVRGEITEFKRYPSGHLYFSLKDENAKISGIVWKSGVSRLGLQPENGVEVIATGRITTYGERSSYQLIVERMEYAGVGALLARIEMLKKRLGEEGLFAEGGKQPLPLLPAVVGVITSPSGAVLHDICTTVARRFPRPILLWPVPVQGEGAAARIAAAIAGFDAIQPGGPIPRPDVLIVARGGGSLEDLMAFNDEAVVRAAAACRIPLISAVGHETDHTLIDLASDRRAPTPTAAAELAVPARVELASTLQRDGARLSQGLLRLVGEQRLRLGRAERGLPDLPALLGGTRQRLDDRAERLTLALPNLLAARRSQLDRAERAVPDAPALLRAARIAVADRAHRLLIALPGLVRARRSALERVERAMPSGTALLAPRRHDMLRIHLDAALLHAVAGHRRRASPALARLSPAMLATSLREARRQLASSAAHLDSVSYQKVLERGFAMVSDRAGHPLTRAAAVGKGARLTLRFADGKVDAQAAGSAQGTLPF